ncbi:type 1 fimbrial protein [Serratia fonticola]|uniref:fimbrial protein n=1 Tax=Serratia fonticola TaxID=47917 RepID=UPI0015C601C5|nr:type 1 fimbrial protein [Serratia fonticola]NXZ87016.1 type 1 fimbrial protein [Serratia fonticola]
MKKIFTLAPIALILGIVGNVQAATQADVTLQGTIVATTCEVTANNGAATLNVGSFAKTDFISALQQVGDESLVITLKNCSEEEAGALQVSGIVANNTNLFMSDVAQTAGFMLKTQDGTQVTNNTSIPVETGEDGSLTYTLDAGMGVVSTTGIQAGAYNAPIKISFVSN